MPQELLDDPRIIGLAISENKANFKYGKPSLYIEFLSNDGSLLQYIPKENLFLINPYLNCFYRDRFNISGLEYIQAALRESISAEAFIPNQIKNHATIVDLINQIKQENKSKTSINCNLIFAVLTLDKELSHTKDTVKTASPKYLATIASSWSMKVN